MLTLRQLRYLSALARHGHFGRAADACSVTQPALSMQIAELERTLGVKVVERRPGEVFLTEIGREIARRAVRRPAEFLQSMRFLPVDCLKWVAKSERTSGLYLYKMDFARWAFCD